MSPTILPAGHMPQMPQISPSSWAVVDVHGRPLAPTAIAIVRDDVFFLDPKDIWQVPEGKTLLTHGQPLQATRMDVKPPSLRTGCLQGMRQGLPPLPHLPLKDPGVNAGVSSQAMKSTRVPIHELANFVACPDQDKLVVLDKSGDLFEFSVTRKTWTVLRANSPVTSSPDPEFVDLACTPDGICVLDPERNQIWKFTTSSHQSHHYFPEILPWRVKPGDLNVSDGVSIAFDGDTYVLKRNGNISKYRYAPGTSKQERFSWAPLKHMRPSRITTGPAMPLYVVERENNRVIAIDKTTGRSQQFMFSADADLKGLLPEHNGFWIIDGNRLVHKSLSDRQISVGTVHPRRIDGRLDGMILPIEGSCLPRHPGVWPGARRLYRYGVHKGVDFFDDAGCSTRIVMGTPVHASDTGKVTRADVKFQDLDSRNFARVMGECRRQHNTSEKNEDLLRGRQVWIDHGNGVITRYAHLDKIKDGIQAGSYVSRGDVIGYVGVSGTGENLPGHVKHPHLHFELWLDGNYLGFGLTTGETFGLYEDIFGTAAVR